MAKVNLGQTTEDRLALIEQRLIRLEQKITRIEQVSRETLDLVTKEVLGILKEDKDNPNQGSDSGVWQRLKPW